MLNKPVLYLSHYFKAHRQEYYERLQAVRDRGDWEGWLAFFLKGLVQVSAQAAETARRILALREEHRSLIAERLGRAAGNGHRVLQHLYVRPIVSAREIQTLRGTTFAGANQVVHRLVDIGVLVETPARHGIDDFDTSPTCACSTARDSRPLLLHEFLRATPAAAFRHVEVALRVDGHRMHADELARALAHAADAAHHRALSAVQDPHGAAAHV